MGEETLKGCFMTAWCSSEHTLCGMCDSQDARLSCGRKKETLQGTKNSTSKDCVTYRYAQQGCRFSSCCFLPYLDLHNEPSDFNLDSREDGANRLLKNSADNGSTHTSLCGGMGLPGDAFTARSAFLKNDDTRNYKLDSTSLQSAKRNGSVVFSYERKRQVIQVRKLKLYFCFYCFPGGFL